MLLRFFRSLGCIAARRRSGPATASSIHYAGTFPITPATAAPLTCDRDGRLRGTRAVYLARRLGLPWLPPKGLTFNMMANADRVGTRLARTLG